MNNIKNKLCYYKINKLILLTECIDLFYILNMHNYTFIIYHINNNYKEYKSIIFFHPLLKLYDMYYGSVVMSFITFT